MSAGTVGVVVQARMGSTRFPGKVLASLAGRPVLEHVVERVRRARRPATVAVATSRKPGDDAVAALCDRLGVPCVRGDEADVLGRYLEAVHQLGLDTVVRITADCPLVDPALVDRVTGALLDHGADYASNINPATWPHGLDVEAVTREALERSGRDATDPAEREHVTLHIRRRLGAFRTVNLAHEEDLSSHRWVLDHPEDLPFLEAVFAQLEGGPSGWRDVWDLVQRTPRLSRLVPREALP